MITKQKVCYYDFACAINCTRRLTCVCACACACDFTSLRQQCDFERVKEYKLIAVAVDGYSKSKLSGLYLL